MLAAAVEWALAHEVAEVGQAATWGDTPVPLAGPGAPLVSEFAVVELAAALGLSTDAGRRLVAEGLELAHRLPRLWGRVQAGSLVVWKARRIAAATPDLSVEAAAFVDAQVAPYAHRVGSTQLARLVDEAIARFMPEFAEERRAAAADGRHLIVESAQVSFNGTTMVHGELDLADALDLEAAVQAGAEALKAAGSDEGLDARRAAALGALARGETALDLRAADVAPAPRPARRDLTLFVHLGDSDVAEIEGHGLVTKAQVAAWCGAPEARITVRPVIDLNQPQSAPGYAVPDRIRQQVVLRDRTCVFPWCTRNARRCDLDHVVAFHPERERRDPGAQTSTENLAPLCRRHHRIKTHGGWAYTMLEPGTYLWRSPRGYSYLRDRGGTQDLTPPTVDPPDG